ncbi:hypothetical protein VTN00DRAFT_4742 [Thermoascus crustaceus]|uniref:uncharacterized protein n=1 Tax=Thermoascus crustaceus TaxID=5088 RepID=UPI0037428245
MPQQGQGLAGAGIGTRPLRALAPRTPSMAESSTPAPGTGAATEEGGKMKRASSACKECKRRRIKCTTGNPCAECAAHGRTCIYDELADKRRKLAAKRTQEELEYYRGLLERLLLSIRCCERENVDQIISVIRRGASLPEISTVVDLNLHSNKDRDRRDSEMEDAEGEEDGEYVDSGGTDEMLGDWSTRDGESNNVAL